MKRIRGPAFVRRLIVIAVAVCCPFFPAPAAEIGASIPPILESGFAIWAKNGAAFALDVWQKGGLIEGDHKLVAEARYLKRIEPLVGSYKSYDVIDSRKISQNSHLVYLAINFERAAVYARFLTYHSDENWVVQNMDFNLKPELIVPWLAFGGGGAAE